MFFFLTEKGKVSGTTTKVTGVSVDVHMQGEVDQSKHHSYTIPPGTVIGFSCTKLDLNENGNLSMHIGVDKVDSIEAHILSPASKVEKMKEELAPLFDFKKLAEFRSILHGILETPQYIDNLLELVLFTLLFTLLYFSDLVILLCILTTNAPCFTHCYYHNRQLG